MARVRRVVILAVALSVLGWSIGVRKAWAADEKATGTVTAVAADSVTVKVKDKDMKFGVDAKTVVEAAGAGTKSRQAQAAGATGPKLGDVVKVGGAVEVTYTAGTMHASMIRAVASAGGGSMSSDQPATKSASGTVKSVAADSFTVTSGGKDWTFTVDAKTTVVGTGVGTKTKSMGGKAAFADLVGAGDKVSVTYHEAGMHASRVTITSKAKK